MIPRSNPTQSTADVIPFPLNPDMAAKQRLAQALTNLSTALAEQHAALAAWRQALLDLRGAVGTLGENLQSYSNKLGTVKDDVMDLNAKARQLEHLTAGS